MRITTYQKNLSVLRGTSPYIQDLKLNAVVGKSYYKSVIVAQPKDYTKSVDELIYHRGLSLYLVAVAWIVGSLKSKSRLQQQIDLDRKEMGL